MARHIINVHLNANKVTAEPQEGEIPLLTFKKFIHYCRTHCGPRLSAEAGEKLKSRYVMMRSGNHEQEKLADKRLPIPITVRQLEAIIRISESLAKMQLQPFATEVHVNEALRLFQVSTLDAASSGTLDGAEGFTSDADYEMLMRVEKQLKRRFAIGSQVSEQTIYHVSRDGHGFIYIFKFILAYISHSNINFVCSNHLFRISLSNKIIRNMLFEKSST